MSALAGPWYIDDTLTFTVPTHAADTGAVTDADAVPAYRVYEDETGTAIATGNMAKLDDANTTGFYSEQLTLSAANGYEVGKSYNIYISAAVGGVTGATTRQFKIIRDLGKGTAHGAAVAGTLSTTQMSTNLTEATDDHFVGRVIVWTSGVLDLQASRITDYDGATKTLTYTATTEAPSATDTFQIH